MNNSDSSFRPIWPARLRAVFEIIMVSGVVSSLMASLVFAAIFGRNRLKLMETDTHYLTTYLLFESAVAFLILFILMKMRRETLPLLGWPRRRWKTHVLIGILAAPCLLIVSGAVVMAFQFFLPKYALEKNPLMEMINSPWQLALFIITGIIAGGIKEELQRAFILNRFIRHLGGAWVGLAVWSLVFGAGHSAQGMQGVCAASILGLIFGILYLARGNLILPITAHAVYNTLSLLIYWFAIGINKQIS
jgi:membrane protease YdiL (CAAX protease family)